MVLESQMGRTGGGGGRQYMSSRRGGRFSLKGPLAALVVIGVVGLSYYMIKASGGTSQANGDQPNVAVNVGADDDGEAPARRSPPIPPAPVNDPAITPRHEDPPSRSTAPAPQPAPEPARQAQPRQVAPPPPAQTAPRQADQTTTSPAVRRQIETGRTLLQRNQLVAGREALNEALRGPISDRDAAAIRSELAAVNEKLVFSPLVDQADPYTAWHVLQPGEYLSTVAPQYDVPWRFIQHVNRISDVRRIRANQRLKVIKGPFHVVVGKSEYRADVYLGQGADRVYIRSFKVGTGEFDSTPTGRFVVRKHSKLTNPEWVNPRTGERYLADDPENPIGEHWIGLRGVDEKTRPMRGYGLHGTIEPSSIGTQSSMGCVRFMPDDIELLFAMLVAEKSTVTIQP